MTAHSAFLQYAKKANVGAYLCYQSFLVCGDIEWFGDVEVSIAFLHHVDHNPKKCLPSVFHFAVPENWKKFAIKFITSVACTINL
jgi:hypothetical protein